MPVNRYSDVISRGKKVICRKKISLLYFTDSLSAESYSKNIPILKLLKEFYSMHIDAEVHFWKIDKGLPIFS
jgi:hypothetical protein